MDKSRLTSLSDGILAIIITIMVLELRVPAGAGWRALGTAAPSLVTYAVSFVFVAIYWNNHHHFFHLVHRVNGAVLWANLNLMFWLSLIPFATDWLAAHPGAAAPTATYGVALLLPALAWAVMEQVVVRAQGPHRELARALGGGAKEKLSLVLYVAGIAAAFWQFWLADACYLAVAGMWLIPDRRIERAAGSDARS